MKFKLKFKDLYGQTVTGESDKEALFNVVKDPTTREIIFYRIYANNQYNKVKEEEYYRLRNLMKNEYKIIQLKESTSYIFRGRLNDDSLDDKGRDVYIGVENHDKLCVNINLKEGIDISYTFESEEGEVILQKEDYLLIQSAIREIENHLIMSGKLILNNPVIEPEYKVEKEVTIKEDEVKEEVINENKKTTISDFVSNLKFEDNEEKKPKKSRFKLKK